MVYVIKQFETTNYLKLNLVGLSILDVNISDNFKYLTEQKPVQRTTYGNLVYKVLGSDDRVYELLLDKVRSWSTCDYAFAVYKSYRLDNSDYWISSNLDYEIKYKYNLNRNNLRLLKNYLKEDVFYWDTDYVETLINGLSDKGLDKLMLGDFNYV